MISPTSGSVFRSALRSAHDAIEEGEATMTYETLHEHADHAVEIRSDQGCATVECFTCSKTVHVAIRTADEVPPVAIPTGWKNPLPQLAT